MRYANEIVESLASRLPWQMGHFFRSFFESKGPWQFDETFVIDDVVNPKSSTINVRASLHVRNTMLRQAQAI